MDIAFWLAIGSAAIGVFHLVAAKTKNKTIDKIDERLKDLEGLIKR